MKKIVLIVGILTLFLNASGLTVKQIQEMVEGIHEKREGVKLSTLDNTKEPFVRIEDNSSTGFLSPKNVYKEINLVLHAIMNGKGYINGSWIKVGDVIKGYKLKYVGQRGVVLRNGNSIKKLYLHRKKDNMIKFEEKN